MGSCLAVTRRGGSAASDEIGAEEGGGRGVLHYVYESALWQSI